jgi:hypothetical protein
MVNLVKACIMLAGGEGDNVVRGEHLGQTAVVCDQSRNNAKVTSDLNNVDFLVEEACIVIVEWITPSKAPGIRTNTQNQERRCEEEEQCWQANRLAERANAMGNKDTLLAALNTIVHILMRSSRARRRSAKWMKKTHKNKNVTIIQERR